jgi:inhibitor of KinA sporulation pathway (predicted exonuclease)
VDLTGIQQQQVDAAEPLAVVLQQHHAWLQQQGLLDRSLRCIAVTWTEWDLKVGNRRCSLTNT